ncbi:hypothetical protein HHK36_001281 [Tetracentron sinense]|uniref:Rhodanese domain-containing protein n=1 Tax=Tetracentron sinense TaxID=13715 RepID=A0A834ZXW2_TETSI|nr:hypothetical protein HHK36_001281 [Tetracentron sinense]
MSSVLSGGISRALTYEEALKQSLGTSTSEGGSGFDVEPISHFVILKYAMEILNAASLSPVSVLSDRRTEPRKVLSLSSTSPLKSPKYASFEASPPKLSEVLSRTINGGLVVMSSVLSGGIARALTYEEVLKKSLGTSTSEGGSGFDVGGVFDSVFNFGVENPAIVIGGATILAVPLVLSQVLKNPKPWGVESAKNAYAKLADDGDAQLLDIRAPVEFREVGTPDIRGLKKKAVSIVYKGEDNPGFLKKLSLKFKEPGNTSLVILDKFDGNSKVVAELVTANGFKAAYAIKDGAEGTQGWMNSGLPWIPPKRTLSLGNLTDAISALGEGSDAFPVTLGIAAATGLGLLAFSEVETILQFVGSAALVQFVGKKLLFAEDRKETLQQVDEFLNTKVAPKELVDEIKQIGKALLPLTVDKKALPVSAEGSPNSAVTDTPVQKSETVPTENVVPKVEVAVGPTPDINSVPKTDVKAESLPGLTSPLSPYPYYPDLKPPTSPSPTQP